MEITGEHCKNKNLIFNKRKLRQHFKYKLDGQIIEIVDLFSYLDFLKATGVFQMPR